MEKKLICLLCLICVINYASTENETKGDVQSNDAEKRMEQKQVENYDDIAYSKFSTNQIMGSVQMGIKTYVSSEPGCYLLMPDFFTVEAVMFPQKGTAFTPSHKFPKFILKTYAPNIFNRFRELCGIKHDQYKKSFSSFPLRDLSNSDTNGSLFYITLDDKFIIKTVSKRESKLLQKILPGYYFNLKQNSKTLLPKFFGLYHYKCSLINISYKITNSNINNIRLITMINLIPSDIKIHKKYDLKGLTYNRRASENEKKKNLPTFKDQDFLEHYKDGFYLERQTYLELIKTLRRDCMVLKSFKSIDFSFLITVHYVDGLENENKKQKSLSSDTVEKDTLPIGGIRASNEKGDKLLLFIEIINILQRYDIVKRLGHKYEATRQEGNKVLVHRPELYADRLLDFMTKHVFKEVMHTPNQSPQEFENATLDINIDSPESSNIDKQITSEEDISVEVDLQSKEIENKFRSRVVSVNGDINDKKISTNQIMGSVQLGIKHVMKYLISDPERDLLMPDFMTVKTIIFPPDGSNNTPSHHHPEFTFESYAPFVFHRFRSFDKVQSDNYQQSFCSSPLRELSNPGNSESIFFITENDKFIMKTVQLQESRFLIKILPWYYLNLDQNPNTLLPKMFGLYHYKCNSNYFVKKSTIGRNKKHVRLVVMNNLLPSNIEIHEKYDLKGSTRHREASEKEKQKILPTYRDLDFKKHHPNGFFFKPNAYIKLMKTLKRDCKFLETYKIMDYSLLMGVHYTNRVENTKEMPVVQGLLKDVEDDSEGLSIKGIPATNESGDELVLFIGIIDVLQNYSLMKQLEHKYKSIRYDGKAVSVHRPNFYAERFLNFLTDTVFKKMGSMNSLPMSTEDRI